MSFKLPGWRLLMLSLLLVCQMAMAEMVVIVHPLNTTDALRAAEVRKIFLGRSKSFPNGIRANPFEVTAFSDTRTVFLRDILRKDEGALSAYWARMLFSGKALPPRGFADESDVKNAVAGNTKAIGFIDRALVDDSVKVLRIQ